ncbi:uncharacterized protein BCR38DRAFT_452909 [Pseudomassariella vexata]|uniref:Uncharacterized protein n=1 Tax=Pseudomassariella vexata TaxID=1141098 RepID=A0A1Y2D769_9PEZI|nr:uncharacterized protein BCR38DRAFT_452909 [Pseudomassariella vexata]ORY55122.1 hypothetical protein BCR38DRAFT_452909 [Pseudomassariella vexata]
MDMETPLEDGDQPPPYSPPSLNNQYQPAPSTPQFHPNSLTSHLHDHLSSLPYRIRQTQQHRNAQQTSSDVALLDHLVPIIESFLRDLGAQSIAPPLATLTLVPEAAVPEDAVLSGLDDMLRRGEIGRVFRVSILTARKDSKGETKPSSTGPPTTTTGSREFTDWGRWGSSGGSFGSTEPSKLFWWRDEDLAKRLALYLQPQPQPQQEKPSSTPSPAAQISAVQTAVEQRIPADKEKKGGRGFGWGKWRSVSTGSPAAGTSSKPPTMSESSRSGRGSVAGGFVSGLSEERVGVGDGERTEMRVTAEEVAFRRQNDFGIYESMSGVAVVVTVRVRP